MKKNDIITAIKKNKDKKMKINLNEIYAKLEAWRDERKITAQSQKEGYLVNVMEELGELAGALRCYEQIKEFLNKNKGKMCGYQYHKHSLMLIEAEHGIIDALCDIAIFTINAGADSNYKPQTLDTYEKDEIITRDVNYRLKNLLTDCGAFNIHSCYCGGDLLDILTDCAKLCEHYGFNFEIAMRETIKEISSRTGSYDEKAKKWVKDTSDEARKKWYRANYELARIEKEKTN